MENRIYWQESLSQASPIPGQPPPDTCDVVVIGAGLTGLSTAYHLARKGASVCVLESGPAGDGASIRNAGMTLTGLKLFPHELISKYGQEQALRLYRTSTIVIDFIAELIRREGIDCDFSRCGALWAAYGRSHVSNLAAAQRILKSTFDYETRLIGRKELPAELGSKLYHGALIDPLSAGLNPAKLTRGLLNLARKTGVRICEQTPVVGMLHRNRHILMETDRGAVRAAKVVVATNGYTPSFLKFLRRRVIPLRSYIVVTEPLPPELAEELIPRNRMVFDTKHLLYYFRRIDGSRLLFGGRVSFGEMDDRSAAEKLQQAMQTVFPQLKPFRVEYYWSGNVGFTFDQMPHLGCNDRIYYALGYCGHGVAMSVYAGHVLAAMISGESLDMPFSDLRFKGRFYYRQKPWFLPLAGAFYKMMDRLER
jgi:glycine/D-amino acid oxidase-like deaminating enzyme